MALNKVLYRVSAQVSQDTVARNDHHKLRIPGMPLSLKLIECISFLFLFKSLKFTVVAAARSLSWARRCCPIDIYLFFPLFAYTGSLAGFSA